MNAYKIRNSSNFIDFTFQSIFELINNSTKQFTSLWNSSSFEMEIKVRIVFVLNDFSKENALTVKETLKVFPFSRNSLSSVPFPLKTLPYKISFSL